MTHSWSGAVVAAVLSTCTALAAQQQFDELSRGHLPLLQAGSLPPVVTDFDGDGLDDLFFGGQVRSLLLRSGPAVFTDASDRLPLRGGLRDRGVAALDYDRDGDADLLLARFGRESQLYRNDGAAGFVDVSQGQPWMSVFPPPQTQVLATGDVNGDGLVDIVFGDLEPNDRIYHGQAGGFSYCPLCQPAPLPGTFAALLEDFDGDGDLDLFRLASTGGPAVTVGVLETNDGLGHWTVVPGAIATFGSEMRGAVAVDYDHDGDPDVLAFGDRPGLALYVNVRGRAFGIAGAPAQVGVGLQSITVADRNGDGFDDLLVTSASGTQVLRGTVGGRFLDFPGLSLPDERLGSFSGGFVDADGDNDLDIVLHSGQVELWLDERDRFVRATAAELTSLRGPLAIGDVDGDGDLDALICSGFEPDRVGYLMLNDGDGRFVHGVPLPTTPSPVQPALYAVALVDLDADGALDALVGQGARQPVLFMGRGDGTFAPPAPTAFPLVTTPQAAFALGDVDADGDLDLAIAGNGLSGFANAVSLLLNDGNGTFAEAPAGSVPALFELAGDVEFADIEGDGDLDLLVGCQNRTSGSQLRAWQNDGAGVFSAAALPPGTPGYDTSVTVGDFDRDGDVDVATGQALLANDGTGVFADVTARRTDAPLGIAPAFVDVDLDGDLDLLTYQSAFRQDAGGMFHQDSALFGDRVPRVYAAADLDGDGDPDLLSSYVMQRNLHRELSVPLLPRVGGSLRVTVDSQPGYGPNGQVALVWIGARRAASPVVIPALGAFRLDPTEILLSQPVLLLAGGRGEATIPVPAAASLAGADVHTQALILGATYPDWRLTRAETITIL